MKTNLNITRFVKRILLWLLLYLIGPALAWMVVYAHTPHVEPVSAASARIQTSCWDEIEMDNYQYCYSLSACMDPQSNCTFIPDYGQMYMEQLLEMKQTVINNFEKYFQKQPGQVVFGLAFHDILSKKENMDLAILYFLCYFSFAIMLIVYLKNGRPRQE